MENDFAVVTKTQWLKGNWTALRNEVLFSTVLSQGAKLCCLAIVAHIFSGDSKTAWPGQKRLARILHVSARTVRMYLSELKDVGLLRVKRRGNNQSNIYYLCEPNVELLKPVPLSLTPNAKSGGEEINDVSDRKLVAYKEEEDINDDAVFSKENTMSSKNDTTGVLVKADDLSIGFSPVSGILDRYIKSKEDGGINEPHAA